MLEGAVRSFAFGATLAAAVGPIALLILNYGIRSGLRPGVAAGLGAALADLTYALAAFSIGSLLLARLVQYERMLRSGSGVVLIGIGIWLIVRATGGRPAQPAEVAGRDTSRPLVTTFLLTLVNPLTIVVFVSFAAQLPLRASVAAAVLFALSLFLGSLIVQMVFAVGGATLSRFVSRPVWIRALNVSSGAAIAAFGLVALIEDAA